VLWLQDKISVESFCASAREAKLLVLDTESNHFHAYTGRLCLLQLATPEQVALIDPLAVDRTALDPLFQLLADPDTVKVLHSAQNDIREFDRDYQIPLRNVFDTQVAASFLGYKQLSLAFLIEKQQGVVLQKRFQRFDWSTRPLPEDAREYAASDVIYLPGLYTELKAKLDQAGWLAAHRQRCDHLCRTTHFTSKPFDPQDWRRIKEIQKLNGRGRAIIQSLFTWRHELCIQINRAAVLTLDNAALVHIAQIGPQTLKKLSAIKGVRNSLLKHHGEAILKAVEQGKQAPIPPPFRVPSKKAGKALTEKQEACFNALRALRKKIATQHNLPFELIANNDCLHAIAKNAPNNPHSLAQTRDLLPWQIESYGQAILQVVNK
jgi:ribonuclease D